MIGPLSRQIATATLVSVTFGLPDCSGGPSARLPRRLPGIPHRPSVAGFSGSVSSRSARRREAIRTHLFDLGP